MNKITAKDFETNRRMCNKDVLRYTESFAAYLSNLVHFFNESLVPSEIRWALFLIQRIDLFIKDSPPSKSVLCGRYQRVQTKLKKLLENGNN